MFPGDAVWVGDGHPVKSCLRAPPTACWTGYCWTRPPGQLSTPHSTPWGAGWWELRPAALSPKGASLRAVSGLRAGAHPAGLLDYRSHPSGPTRGTVSCLGDLRDQGTCGNRTDFQERPSGRTPGRGPLIPAKTGTHHLLPSELRTPLQPAAEVSRGLWGDRNEGGAVTGSTPGRWGGCPSRSSRMGSAGISEGLVRPVRITLRNRFGSWPDTQRPAKKQVPPFPRVALFLGRCPQLRTWDGTAGGRRDVTAPLVLCTVVSTGGIF